MKPVRFHPEADAEMMSAARFYEARQKDLGKRFFNVHSGRSPQNPSKPPPVSRNREGVRRCLTMTFPFAVVFRDMPGQFVIIAVDAPAS